MIRLSLKKTAKWFDYESKKKSIPFSQREWCEMKKKHAHTENVVDEIECVLPNLPSRLSPPCANKQTLSLKCEQRSSIGKKKSPSPSFASKTQHRPACSEWMKQVMSSKISPRGWLSIIHQMSNDNKRKNECKRREEKKRRITHEKNKIRSKTI